MAEVTATGLIAENHSMLTHIKENQHPGMGPLKGKVGNCLNTKGKNCNYSDSAETTMCLRHTRSLS